RRKSRPTTATVRLADGALIDVALDAARAARGDQVTLGIRPEHMSAGLQGGAARGNSILLDVRHAEYLGDQTIAYAALQGEAGLLAVRQASEAEPLAPGSRIIATLPPQRCHLFDASGQAFLHPVTIENAIRAAVV
ncbi:MAG: TOBE domain-containing protein, partial [Telluria sp.]